jgi:restriction system protein
MAFSKKSKPNKRGMDTLLEKGLLVAGAGVAVLLSPLFLGSVPPLKPVAQGLRGFAWPLIILGLILIAVHFAFKSKAAKTATKREPVLLHSGLGNASYSWPASARPLPATAWSPAVFAAIEWRRFEAAV